MKICCSLVLSHDKERRSAHLHTPRVAQPMFQLPTTFLRPNCFGKSRLHSYESWTNTKFKALGSLDKCWWTSIISTATTRLCRSKKRMSATTTTSLWRRQSSSTNQFIRLNKGVKIRLSISKEVKNTTTLLIRKQDGNVTKSSSETCHIHRLRRLHSSWQNSSWQSWNSWWWRSSKPDEGQWMTFFCMQFRIAGT